MNILMNYEPFTEGCRSYLISFNSVACSKYSIFTYRKLRQQDTV